MCGAGGGVGFGIHAGQPPSASGLKASFHPSMISSADSPPSSAVQESRPCFPNIVSMKHPIQQSEDMLRGWPQLSKQAGSAFSTFSASFIFKHESLTVNMLFTFHEQGKGGWW